MPTSAEERIQQLTKGMLRKELYVVLSKGDATPEQIGAHLPQHLEYMIGLEKKGVLFASGPLRDAAGKTRGDGLTIIRAASADEARKIAERDPFVVNKLRTFELKQWTVMEGSLSIKVNLSDQSLELA
ncbi:MAG TPA: YciI family protein [Xanthobacteraceae bacterium]|nr:YciI family protein [Xanthobacteraceae bacterium]